MSPETRTRRGGCRHATPPTAGWWRVNTRERERVPVFALFILVAIACPRASSCGEMEFVSPRELLRRASAIADRSPLGRVSPARGTTGAPMAWTALGPDSITGVVNPGDTTAYVAAGRVNAIAVDPRNGDIAYAAAAQGGVWKTEDGGATWTARTDALSSLSSGAVALDPANPDVVYYGTGEQNF